LTGHDELKIRNPQSAIGSLAPKRDYRVDSRGSARRKPTRQRRNGQQQEPETKSS
jgi:hypothetical protein